MSARLARPVFQSAARRARSSLPSAATSVSRRAMSSTSHGPAKSSDTPWIVGATLVFGPAFLYLISPTARKNTVGVHDDARQHPGLKSHHHAPAHEKHEDPAVLMKDDEGTVANVGATIALSEGSDVPKDSQGPEKQVELRTEAEIAEVPVPAPAESEAVVNTSEDDKVPQPEVEPVAGENKKSGTYQKEGEEGPTDLSKAQGSAQKGIVPKQAAEAKN